MEKIVCLKMAPLVRTDAHKYGEKKTENIRQKRAESNTEKMKQNTKIGNKME